MVTKIPHCLLILRLATLEEMHCTFHFKPFPLQVAVTDLFLNSGYAIIA